MPADTTVYWRINPTLSHVDVIADCSVTPSTVTDGSGLAINTFTVGSSLHGMLPAYVDVSADVGFSTVLTTSPLIELE